MRILLVALLLFLAGCAGPMPGRTLGGWERAEATSSWEAVPSHVPEGLSWRAVDGVLFRDGARATWLRTRVSCPPGARDPVVFLPKVYVGVDAYVEGLRVGPTHTYRWASGTPWYAVPIDCTSPEPVAFRVRSGYTQIGFPEAPLVGERAEVVGHLLARDLPQIVLGIVFLLIGLVSAVLAFGRRERRAMLGLATYGVGLAGWTVFHTRSKQLWWPAMEHWFAVWWVSVPLVAFGALLFVEAFFGPGPRRVLRGFVLALGGVTVAAALSLLLRGDPFRTVATPIFVAGRFLLLLGAVLVAVHLTRLARRGNREAGLLLAGFGVAFVTVFRDVMLSIGWIEGQDTWTQYGYAGFGITLVLLVRRRMVHLQLQLAMHAEALERYVRERDVLMKDLHDGLGGIVTNVRMLAERGADEEDRGVLKAISKLAADGVTEVRTLIFGFDGPPQTWRQVAGELRRAGATALAAHGIEHEFVRDVAEVAPPPDLMLVINLVRIHREALTNALKHAEASRVEVRLRVTDDELELVVADDGVGLNASPRGDQGVGMSKGIASMRSRARSLGGELTVDGDGGTRVHLRSPLRVGPAPASSHH